MMQYKAIHFKISHYNISPQYLVLYSTYTIQQSNHTIDLQDKSSSLNLNTGMHGKYQRCCSKSGDKNERKNKKSLKMVSIQNLPQQVCFV